MILDPPSLDQANCGPAILVRESNPDVGHRHLEQASRGPRSFFPSVSMSQKGLKIISLEQERAAITGIARHPELPNTTFLTSRAICLDVYDRQSPL